MHVFVYGTLKRGYGNHHYLEREKYVGPARLARLGTLYDSGFPVLAFGGPNSSVVHGELYNVLSHETIKRLDRLEGLGRMYDRIWVELGDGLGTAQTYVGCPDFVARLKPLPRVLGHYRWPAEQQ